MSKLHDRLTARQVRAAVEGADIFDLVCALVEPDSCGYLPAMDEGAFPCPACQLEPVQWIQWGPRARPLDHITWKCNTCQATGTRWGLARRVIEDPAALQRFLSHPPAAA